MSSRCRCPLRLGTRGSPLALAQAGRIARQLLEQCGRPAVVVRVATPGDMSAAPITLPDSGGLVSRGGIPASRNAAAPYPCDHDRMPLRCMLVDDNDAFLEAASVLLEREGLTVVGVASSIAEALRQARALRPDLILVDIGLGDESGFDLAQLLAGDG